jgi:peptide/nickel transport system permease protein
MRIQAMGRINGRKIKTFVHWWHRYSENRSAVVGLIVVGGLFILSMMAPLLTSFNPLNRAGGQLLSPSGAFPMGTDDLGRDIFTQFLYGGRVSYFVGFVAAFISTTIGILFGALSGYYGGMIDDVLQRVTEMLSIIPRYFLAMVTVAILGRSIFNVTLVIGILSWPPTSRLTRAEFSSLKTRAFVDAARMTGASAGSIIFDEILPNALPPVIVQTILTVSSVILLEATLSFLGLGDPTLMSWGLMLQNAQSFLRSAPWMALFPGLGIFFCILGLNLMGDGLNQALNPRLRTESSR